MRSAPRRRDRRMGDTPTPAEFVQCTPGQAVELGTPLRVPFADHIHRFHINRWLGVAACGPMASNGIRSLTATTATTATRPTGKLLGAAFGLPHSPLYGQAIASRGGSRHA